MTETPLHPLAQALALTPAADGGLQAVLHADFSNAPVSQPPTAGFPFGGLLAALCVGAMRQGLGLETALRTLSVQYLASAAYDAPLIFTPKLLRGGRTVAYTALDVTQSDRLTHHATATWGGDQPGVLLEPAKAPPPPLATMDPKATIGGPLSPRFARYVDYLFDGGPNILGGNEGRPAVERVWMRIKGGGPLTEAGLCYLLDALYPPSWTAFSRPPPMTTIDLRYDLFEAVTPDTAPDGWLFFEFRVLTLENGWTVDDAMAWLPDGRPLAASRQRRKLLADRAPEDRRMIRPTVIGNPVSPYVRKVLAACAVKGVEVDIDPITPFLADDAFETLSPLRRIPVWIEGDLVLNDSRVICEYIEESRPGPSLWPASPAARAKARWLEEYADIRLGELLLWKLFFRLALQPRLFKIDADEAETAATKALLPAAFDYLESVTPETGFLFGPAAGMADFSVAAPFVNAAVVGVTVEPDLWPRLAAWLERMETTPLGPLNDAARALVRTPIKAQRDRLPEFGLTPAARDHLGDAPRRGPMTPT